MANLRFALLPQINAARCTGCGRCVAVCPPHVLSLEPTGWRKSAVLGDAQACTGCSQCDAVCPFGAIAMVKKARVAAGPVPPARPPSLAPHPPGC